MATVKHVPEKVKKVVEAAESFVLTLSKDEALLLYGLLGATAGQDKWGKLAYAIFDKLGDCGLPLNQSPYSILEPNPIRFDGKVAD